MTMMTYGGDQVSGGRQGLLVIGSHALLANPDLKHDQANDQDYHCGHHHIGQIYKSSYLKNGGNKKEFTHFSRKFSLK